MKLTVELLGMPDLTNRIGGKRLQLDIEGHSVQDLLQALLARYGPLARQALLDESGQLDLTVQVLRNGKEWITHDRLGQPLEEGDQVALMMLVAGG